MISAAGQDTAASTAGTAVLTVLADLAVVGPVVAETAVAVEADAAVVVEAEMGAEVVVEVAIDQRCVPRWTNNGDDDLYRFVAHMCCP